MHPDLPYARPAPGSLQTQRALAAQDPATFSVEERGPLDWFAVWQAQADDLRFYAPDGRAQGRWSALLPAREHWPALAAWLEHGTPLPAALATRVADPDLALLLAFLRLQRHPRAAFAALTERHRQDYYRRRLALAPRRGTPDEADLIVTPDPDAPPLTLPVGSAFDAGVDTLGQPRVYHSLDALPLSAATLERVYSLGQTPRGLILRRCLDRASGVDWDAAGNQVLGEDGLADDGSTLRPLSAREHYHVPGVRLLSPLLALEAGTRTLRLGFARAEADAWRTALRAVSDGAPDLAATFNACWRAQAGTADGALELPPATLAFANRDTDALLIEWRLDATAPALAGADGQAPWLALTLRPPTAADLGYLARLHTWQTLQWQTPTLEVVCDGLAPAAVRNSQGLADASQAFDAFPGPVLPGHRLYLAHRECWTKPLSELRVALRWEGRPKSLADHYTAYRQALGQAEGWPRSAVLLAQSATSPYAPLLDEPPILDADTQTLRFALQADARAPAPLPATPDADPLAWPDWFALEYRGDGLGHAEEARVASFHTAAYTSAMLEWSRNPDLDGDGSPNPPPQPTFVPAPYTPRLAGVSLGYSSRVARGPWLIVEQEHPVGRLSGARQGGVGQNALYPVAPEYGAASGLYLGIDRLTTPCVLTLRPDVLLQNAPLPAAALEWKVLTAQGWQRLQTDKQGQNEQPAALLGDQSNGLNNSGIVRLRLPELWRDDAGLCWLSLQLPPDDAARPAPPRFARLLSLALHAVRVRYQGDSDVHLVQPLPAASITAPLPQHPLIASVTQPAASQGGHPGESDAQFAVRAAERLNHKGRALHARDYERLVLDAFPAVRMARAERDHDGTPGRPRVRLMVVPQPDPPTLLQPRPHRALQRAVFEHLSPLMPPGVTLAVVAPRYRVFRVVCSLVLDAAYDAGVTLERLNRRLLTLLSPWQERATPAQALYLSEVSHLLARQEGVRQVVALSSQYLADDGRWLDNPRPWLETCTLRFGGIAGATLAAADLLVPATQHVFVQLLRADLPYQGLGVMEIGLDFEIPYTTPLFIPAPLGQARLGADLALTA